MVSRMNLCPVIVEKLVWSACNMWSVKASSLIMATKADPECDCYNYKI